MNKDLELWQFIDDRLAIDQLVMLLVVAESRGSSPGRPGYKMAVGCDGELAGSIGGGLMEVNLVEQCRAILASSGQEHDPNHSEASYLIKQVHRANSSDSSGMICSGQQTVIFKLLGPYDQSMVTGIIGSIRDRTRNYLTISKDKFDVLPAGSLDLAAQMGDKDHSFTRPTNDDFLYLERLGKKHELIIAGGGHCALALSEIMSRMDFYIHIIDDSPQLNTLNKNEFADRVTLIDDYARIGEFIEGGDNVYVAVMTLGYASDAIVIRQLIHKPFKYFGVLGSKAKMATLLKNLADEGYPADVISNIRTPIGIDIGSQTPDEIAVSICAEIISVKNA